MLITTDASIYEIEPKDVIYPISREDLIGIIRELLSKRQSFTMRAGGTSIGGQAIGEGVLVDVSKHLTSIVSFSEKKKEVLVEPGVIQDDLNDFLRSSNLKFAPDTSTSNRAMIGGMIGNNSCGSYSVFYGTTRDHVKSVEVILSDGSLVIFKEVDELELKQKMSLQTLEGKIYRFIVELLTDNYVEILEQFPHESLIRRNTGYAIDVLLRECQPFNVNGKRFNLASLICGSEGTLGVVVRATLGLVELPHCKGLLVAHFASDHAALSLVDKLLQQAPSAVEYMDKPTLEASRGNIQQAENRSWINGSPEAVLIIEFLSDTHKELDSNLTSCQSWLLLHDSYHVEVIDAEEHYKVWEIRKAGLGLLMGKVGARKAIAVIEDAAVPLKYLYAYYKHMKDYMRSYGVNAVYYGHASVGLIHIRPELNLEDSNDRIKMVGIAKESSRIVKKYKGSLSGEHGDGRIRAAFLKEQFGEHVYQYLANLKRIFDPKNLLNPGVVISDQDMLTNVRHVDQPVNDWQSGFDWNKDISFFYAVEKCSGAGVCRKSVGRDVMCPSYKATREEKFSTRGRANLLRRALHSKNPKEELNNDELKEALDLCLGCKACKKECPASVDMARLKSEYLYQTQKNQDQFSLWYIKNLGNILRFGSYAPTVFNFFQNNKIVMKSIGINRSMPTLRKDTLTSWWNKNKKSQERHDITVWILCDLFTEYYDINIGKELILFLEACNVKIELVSYKKSIIAMISKGLLVESKEELESMRIMLEKVSENDFIVGIEPSETIIWRDEAKDLIQGVLPEVLLFEELILKLKHKNLLPKLNALNSKIWVHTHCHQKALPNDGVLSKSLELISGVEVKMLDSGCCGMAGDFGYKNSNISKVIAHQSFGNSIDEINKNDIFVATGTSCRRQISDVFSLQSIHLSQLFFKAL
jgi:FAD/FMN-containing dehydrogenase/Fe-S oxidoreductase